MGSLSPRDRELVALGAAMGSNCVPCIEYHIPESRNAGLTDEEIQAAIQHADKVRQVPARMTLEAARSKLGTATGSAGSAGASPAAGCAAASDAGDAGAKAASPSMDAMAGMMFRMMASHCTPAPSGRAPHAPEERTAAAPAAGESCGCGSKGA